MILFSLTLILVVAVASFTLGRSLCSKSQIVENWLNHHGCYACSQKFREQKMAPEEWDDFDDYDDYVEYRS